ncbi:MAG: hypothetical protein AMXMBFR13_31330 [Phycisphaerae bacterium]
MPVIIGAKPDASLDQPLALLGDCHRRIEHFLGVLETIVRQAIGGELNDEQRRALEVALHYFHSAAPRHTQDEEESLFPRMRASTDPRVVTALNKLDALEADHAAAAAGHDAVERLGRQWLAQNRLAAADMSRLDGLLRVLREMYQRHILIEDNEVFPLAEELLDEAQLRVLSAEMAARRGIVL